jgi:hypothetical protein
MPTLRRVMRSWDYFTLAFGSIVGVRWMILLDDWLARGGPAGAAVWLATSLAYFRGAGGKATARGRALGLAGAAVSAALLVIVARGFGPYHWLALDGWAAAGLALWMARGARGGSGGTES